MAVQLDHMGLIVFASRPRSEIVPPEPSERRTAGRAGALLN
jgi:hypothetical protein